MKFFKLNVFVILSLMTLITACSEESISEEPTATIEEIVQQIVYLRVAPQRLENIKTPLDYEMNYSEVDIVTPDNIRLSAWEIPAATLSDKTIIINHPLSSTKYGAVVGLDNVPVEFLPMVKHLHDAGYNVITYDHRGQGDSDGGLGDTAIGTEAPVGAGVLEWQDMIGALQYVQNHSDFADDKLSLIVQCMGANAAFLAWNKEPELFNNSNIEAVVAIQPSSSYNFMDRIIKIQLGLEIANLVEEKQIEQFGFGFANSIEDVPAVTVPILFSQVKQDQYAFDTQTNRNDIELIYEACTSQKEMIWIGPNEEIPFGTGMRFDGYNYYGNHPEQLLNFLAQHL